ncbi:hypothetical protein [Coleofasciculus sp. FACHB-1120]|uniref:hypothetical protein n=1 Tax=Coleofasciculus sp. FACHB-1120 TaxID=2692783 RepID=UPI0016865310|nr:hypothetical protein [Coleofasciculus sp. FACHB-1120]MBD2741881.1 hypothetical protein [Coleofasciculus sp. FACHB-1120]
MGVCGKVVHEFAAVLATPECNSQPTLAAAGLGRDARWIIPAKKEERVFTCQQQNMGGASEPISTVSWCFALRNSSVGEPITNLRLPTFSSYLDFHPDFHPDTYAIATYPYK